MANSIKMAFVIMPFDHKISCIYKEVYAPVFEELGFTVKRGDEFHTANPVTSDIERAILDADIILCDMTGGNPNVFYELGLAHCLRKPVLMVARKGEKIPFDIRHIRFIEYDDFIGDLKSRLAQHIKEIALSSERDILVSPLSIIGGKIFSEVSGGIQSLLRLFKDTVLAFSQGNPKFRLHYLKYFDETNLVSMYVQDQTYEDKDFEVIVSDGLKKGIVICEAISGKRLVVKDLPEDHYINYPDCSIPQKLSSVMAFPIKDRNKRVIGVLAMDSTKSFDKLGVEQDDLENVFVKLSQLVEIIIQSKGI